MKRLLLSTSAVALAGAFAVPAHAAEWNVRVSGFMQQYFGYAHTSSVGGAGKTQFNGVDEKSDTEVWFVPAITLDNGIQFGVNIQLEGNSQYGNGSIPGGIDTIDESYMMIKGSFGEFRLGSKNTAGYSMTYAAPNVSKVGVNSGSLTAFIPFSGTAGGKGTGADIFRGTLGSTFLEIGRNNDANMFTYFTPRLFGFQVGASYARDAQQDTNQQYDLYHANQYHDIVDVGVNYVKSFGGIDVAASARWGTAQAPYGLNPNSSHPQLQSYGLNLGYAGFTLGGSWAESNNTGNQDGQSYDAGIEYNTGPWGFSFTYIHGRSVDHENYKVVTANGLLTGQETLAQYMAAVSYKLARGVDLGVFGAYANFNEQYGDNHLPGGNNLDGWVVGSEVNLAW